MCRMNPNVCTRRIRNDPDRLEVVSVSNILKVGRERKRDGLLITNQTGLIAPQKWGSSSTQRIPFCAFI